MLKSVLSCFGVLMNDQQTASNPDEIDAEKSKENKIIQVENDELKVASETDKDQLIIPKPPTDMQSRTKKDDD